VAPRREDVLTISVLPSLASAWLVPRLGGFLAAHPQLQVNLLSSERLVDFDRDASVDAALRMGPGTWPGVTAEHLLDETLAPVASPALIGRMGGLPGDDAALGAWPLLGESDAAHWDTWVARHGGRVPGREHGRHRCSRRVALARRERRRALGHLVRAPWRARAVALHRHLRRSGVAAPRGGRRHGRGAGAAGALAHAGGGGAAGGAQPR